MPPPQRPRSVRLGLPESRERIRTSRTRRKRAKELKMFDTMLLDVEAEIHRGREKDELRMLSRHRKIVATRAQDWRLFQAALLRAGDCDESLRNRANDHRHTSAGPKSLTFSNREHTPNQREAE